MPAPVHEDAEAEIARPSPRADLKVSLLTGGRDKPYALGMAEALASQGIVLDFIGGDDVNGPVLHNSPRVNFLNLRRDQRPDASLANKIGRVVAYYWRLMRYAMRADPKVFHILWNNKFEWFDRTALLLYYKVLGKKIVFTAHNVNAGTRDANDSWLNRLTLRIQYKLSDHVFVHTEQMKHELLSDFGISETNVSVIPFGINNTLPNSRLTSAEAKRLLGLGSRDKTLLFFGNIAPYKGLEHLIAALIELSKQGRDYRLIIAGKPKGCEDYWDGIRQTIAHTGLRKSVVQRIKYIPDEEAEIFFKAADVLALPYVHIFQSGVLFLGYGFGLPVIAADVGSLREEIVEGETGFVFCAKNPVDLAKTIDRYFTSELFRGLDDRRQKIRNYANERYSWAKVGETTRNVYERLLQK